ncbi:MAG TPA: T9SS type A sorting domain-containing protein, partial [Bacteroidia bacterium]|nr:T9SS type A sorting domain-containing protein [Bacteroidia bacterium]
YPSRRAVLQPIATDAANDNIFQSGIFDNNYRVIGETPQFESHHEVIKTDNVTQIYEMVMGDVNGQFTSVLERAAILLKDNRIPPDGFTTGASMYDTVQISADAIADTNFNKINGVEGSGIDITYFRIPVTGLTGAINLDAKLFSQSIPPKGLDEMFPLTTAPIDSFKAMYNPADQSPVLVAADSTVEVLSGFATIANSQNQIQIWPALINDGWVNIQSKNNVRLEMVDIYSTDGKLVFSRKYNSGTNREKLFLPFRNGTYFIKVKSGTQTLTRKIILLGTK